MKYRIIQSTNKNILIGFETSQDINEGKEVVFIKIDSGQHYVFTIINKKSLGKGRCMLQNSNNTLILKPCFDR